MNPTPELITSSLEDAIISHENYKRRLLIEETMVMLCVKEETVEVYFQSTSPESSEIYCDTFSIHYCNHLQIKTEWFFNRRVCDFQTFCICDGAVWIRS